MIGIVRTLKRLVVLGAVLGVSACATLGAKYTPEATQPTDKATIYVYRQSGFFGGAVAYAVKANGVPLASLPAGGYFVVSANPGEIELSAQTEAKTSVTIDAKAGESYYVKGTVGIGFFVGHPHLVLVANDVGAKEIADTKRVTDPIPSAADIAAGPSREPKTGS